jgi:hypothetical protein
MTGVMHKAEPFLTIVQASNDRPVMAGTILSPHIQQRVRDGEWKHHRIPQWHHARTEQKKRCTHQTAVNHTLKSSAVVVVLLPHPQALFVLQEL